MTYWLESEQHFMLKAHIAINMMTGAQIKKKIAQWDKSFIRDHWGNLTECFWNNMAKEEILKLEAKYKTL